MGPDEVNPIVDDLGKFCDLSSHTSGVTLQEVAKMYLESSSSVDFASFGGNLSTLQILNANGN